MHLEKMATEKSIEFLQNAFKSSNIHLSVEIAHYIIQQVDNVPYYIQFLAHQIWEYAMINSISRVDQSIVDSSLQDILELKKDYYWELTNNQSMHRKKLLFALSQDAKELYSEKTSKKYELGAASSTQKSLEVLLNEGIIEKNKGYYEFADPMYKRFIKNNL